MRLLSTASVQLYLTDLSLTVFIHTDGDINTADIISTPDNGQCPGASLHQVTLLKSMEVTYSMRDV
jgi:hypothetical protein